MKTLDVRIIEANNLVRIKSFVKYTLTSFVVIRMIISNLTTPSPAVHGQALKYESNACCQVNHAKTNDTQASQTS